MLPALDHRSVRLVLAMYRQVVIERETYSVVVQRHSGLARRLFNYLTGTAEDVLWNKGL